MNPDVSLADIAAVTDNNRNNSDTWGGNGAWWIIILFLFVFCGWGGNFGGFGGGYGGVGNGGSTQADIYRAIDQQTLLSKIDQQTYGIADSTFALNNAINNGFASAELSRCNQQAALMAQLANMSAANQSCCCETQRLIENGFANTNYNLATQSCDTRNTIQNTTRDIIENQNSNARAILDALNAQATAAKDAKIAEQTQTIFGLQLAASQQAQNNYIVSQLKQSPIPAYVVANPFASASYCGCNGCA